MKVVESVVFYSIVTSGISSQQLFYLILAKNEINYVFLH